MSDPQKAVAVTSLFGDDTANSGEQSFDPFANIGGGLSESGYADFNVGAQQPLDQPQGPAAVSAPASAEASFFDQLGSTAATPQAVDVPQPQSQETEQMTVGEMPPSAPGVVALGASQDSSDVFSGHTSSHLGVSSDQAGSSDPFASSKPDDVNFFDNLGQQPIATDHTAVQPGNVAATNEPPVAVPAVAHEFDPGYSKSETPFMKSTVDTVTTLGNRGPSEVGSVHSDVPMNVPLVAHGDGFEDTSLGGVTGTLQVHTADPINRAPSEHSSVGAWSVGRGLDAVAPETRSQQQHDALRRAASEHSSFGGSSVGHHSADAESGLQMWGPEDGGPFTARSNVTSSAASTPHTSHLQNLPLDDGPDGMNVSGFEQVSLSAAPASPPNQPLHQNEPVTPMRADTHWGAQTTPHQQPHHVQPPSHHHSETPSGTPLERTPRQLHDGAAVRQLQVHLPPQQFHEPDREQQHNYQHGEIQPQLQPQPQHTPIQSMHSTPRSAGGAPGVAVPSRGQEMSMSIGMGGYAAASEAVALPTSQPIQQYQQPQPQQQQQPSQPEWGQQHQHFQQMGAVREDRQRSAGPASYQPGFIHPQMGGAQGQGTPSTPSVPTESGVGLQMPAEYTDLPGGGPPGPSPVISWGFGGAFVVMFPRARRRLNVFSPSKARGPAPAPEKPTMPGPVYIHTVATLAPNDPWVGSLARFPGPVTPATKNVCAKYAEEQSVGFGPTHASGEEICDDIPAESKPQGPTPSQRHAADEARRLLWQVLKHMCESGASLVTRGPEGSDADAASSKLATSILMANRAQFIRDGDSTRGQILRTDAGTTHSDPATKEWVVMEIQNLLVNGKRMPACQLAVQNQLWEHALLIAGHLDMETYKRVVSEFSRQTFVDGTPLRTLYALFAGRQDDVFRVETKQGGVMNPGMMVSSGLISQWRENLAIILGNRTANDLAVARHLGDMLWANESNPAAAHACYLLSDPTFLEVETENVEAQPPNPFGTPQMHSQSNIWRDDGIGLQSQLPLCARVELLGANHFAYPRTFVTPAAVQRTEILEMVRRLENSQHIMPRFQPYKLVYALQLLDVGMIVSAQKYVEAIIGVVEAVEHQYPFNPTFLNLLTTVRDRLQGHGLVVKSTGPPGSSWVSGIFRVFDKGVTKLIGSEEEEQRKQEEEASSQHEAPVHSTKPPTPEKKPPPPKEDKPETETMPARAATSSLANLWGSLGSSVTKLIPIPRTVSQQADLGDANAYVFDEVRKRWVMKGQEETGDDEEQMAPPPTDHQLDGGPTAIAQQRSMSTPIGPSATDVQNLAAGQTQVSAGPPPVSAPPPSAMAGPAVAQRMLGVGHQRASSNPNAALRPPLSPMSNRFSATGHTRGSPYGRSARSRYVDTLNPASSAPAAARASSNDGASQPPVQSAPTQPVSAPASASTAGYSGNVFRPRMPAPSAQSQGGGDVYASLNYDIAPAPFPTDGNAKAAPDPKTAPQPEMYRPL